jgi:hypothetical protein
MSPPVAAPDAGGGERRGQHAADDDRPQPRHQEGGQQAYHSADHPATHHTFDGFLGHRRTGVFSQDGLARVLHREPDLILVEPRGLQIPNRLLGMVAVANESDDGAAGTIDIGHDALPEIALGLR